MNGQLATYKWKDTGEVITDAYFSFGEYDEKTETDGFGVPDNQVFFYTTKEELLANDFDDFEIVEIQESKRLGGMLKITEQLIKGLTPGLERLIEKAWTIGYEQGRKDVITGDVPQWLEN